MLLTTPKGPYERVRIIPGQMTRRRSVENSGSDRELRAPAGRVAYRYSDRLRTPKPLVRRSNAASDVQLEPD